MLNVKILLEVLKALYGIKAQYTQKNKDTNSSAKVK